MARRWVEPIDPVLRTRATSAILLAVVSLVDVVLGGWFFAALVMALLVIAAHEWGHLAHPRDRALAARVAILVAVMPALSLLAVMLGMFDLGLALLALGCVAGAGAASLMRGISVHRVAGGMLYVGLPAVALIWLRIHRPTGLADVVWLFGVVWATDICAYFVGKRLGGPRLAPRFSPNKTWSGLVGGMLGAGLLGWLLATPVSRAPGEALLLGVVMAIVAQLGDLFESHLKRKAGIKDSGTLIPGHGGLLDRVDGLIAAAPAYAAFQIAFSIKAIA